MTPETLWPADKFDWNELNDLEGRPAEMDDRDFSLHMWKAAQEFLQSAIVREYRKTHPDIPPRMDVQQMVPAEFVASYLVKYRERYVITIQKLPTDGASSHAA